MEGLLVRLRGDEGMKGASLRGDVLRASVCGYAGQSNCTGHARVEWKEDVEVEMLWWWKKRRTCAALAAGVAC